MPDPITAKEIAGLQAERKQLRIMVSRLIGVCAWVNDNCEPSAAVVRVRNIAAEACILVGYKLNA